MEQTKPKITQILSKHVEQQMLREKLFCLHKHKNKLSNLIQSHCYLRSQNHCQCCCQNLRSCCCCHSVCSAPCLTQHCFQLREKKKKIRTTCNGAFLIYRTMINLVRPILPCKGSFYFTSLSTLHLAVDLKTKASLQRGGEWDLPAASQLNE